MERRTISAQTSATSGRESIRNTIDFAKHNMLASDVGCFSLPTPPSFTYGGHLFVLELQNISSAGCSLQSQQVALVPTSDTNNQPFYAARRTAIL
jgi:hypothetical protein